MSFVLDDLISVRNYKFQSLIPFFFVVFLLYSLSGCKSDKEEDVHQGIKISNVSIPSQLDVVSGGTVRISGEGFIHSDVLILESDNQKYDLHVSAVDSKSLSCILPTGITSGMYIQSFCNALKNLHI